MKLRKLSDALDELLDDVEPGPAPGTRRVEPYPSLDEIEAEPYPGTEYLVAYLES